MAVGVILTMGRRTITGALWTVRGVIAGHPSTYHRVFTNLYIQYYYLRRYGADGYRQTTLRWLGDRLELARRFVDEQLKTQAVEA